MATFYGKYEGVVDNNFDPLGKGRLLVKVPSIFGDNTVWAQPCVPYAGPDIGFFMMPPANAYVWIEFAAGDPHRAIWSGCFWGDNESPPVSMSPVAEKKKVLKTDTCTLTMDDTPGAGGITIETTSGHKIKLSATGIEVDNGKGATIKLSGPSIKLNEQALEVM